MEEQTTPAAGFDRNQYLLNPPKQRRVWARPSLPVSWALPSSMPKPSPKAVTWGSLGICAVLVVVLLAPLPKSAPAPAEPTAPTKSEAAEQPAAVPTVAKPEEERAPTLPRRVDVDPPKPAPAVAATTARSAPRAPVRVQPRAQTATAAPVARPSSPRPAATPAPAPAASGGGDAASLKPLS